MDKERLVQIGKFLNDRLIIHRNVENNTPWTTEEKMIQELYDNYLDILIKYKKQKEVIDRLNFIKNRKNQGASQENINKMAIEFVNSWLKEVE